MPNDTGTENAARRHEPDPVSNNPKAVDEAQRLSEAAYRSLLENAPFGVCRVHTGTNRFLRANRAVVELLGYDSEEELLQVALSKIFLSAEEAARLPRLANGTDRFRSEVQWTKKDDERIRVRLAGRRVVGCEGGASVVEMTVEDVTERSHLQAVLLQAQRMEAVGQLAGGIAHDFNNALMIVSSCAEVMAEEFPEEHPQHKNAMQILTATRGATRLARQLLTFSRKHVVSPSVFDLSKVVSGVTEMLRRPLGEEIELVVIPNPQKGAVRADPAQIEQILINLAVNAGDAMPEGGTLTLRTENVELDAEFVKQHPGSRQGSFVAVAVADTGCGMDERTQARIFEPFFTTKEKGTGLGLATVYGIMKQSGGYISVESDVGIGTTFKCFLPRFKEERKSKPVSVPRPIPQKGTESVLLVEDDRPLRELVRDFMLDLGYQVSTASDGAQALELMEKTSGPIHLMITDLVIPQISGDQVAARMGQWHPETRVIYLSGYAHERIKSKLIAGARLLQKPFELSLLAQAMREVLDSPAHEGAGNGSWAESRNP